VGESVAAYPALCRRILDEGHEIGNHSMSHPRISGLSYDQLRAQFDAVDRLLEQRELGLRGGSRWIRPPYGTISAALLLYAGRSGKQIVLWTKDPEDFIDSSAERMSRFFSGCRPSSNDIVLLHDKDKFGTDTSGLEKVIELYEDEGIRLVPLGRLLSG